MKVRFFACLLCGLLAVFDVQAQSSKTVIAGKVRGAVNYTNYDQMPELVAKITDGLKTNEDKAYAIYAWIAQFIEYDRYKSDEIKKQNKGNRNKAGEIKKQDILTSRMGVCEDIALLFAQMCTQANVPARLITGCLSSAKNSKECEENPHAWNAVWINGNWELVDVTNALVGEAMSGVSSLARYERKMQEQIKSTGSVKKKFGPKTYSFDDNYFMMSPRKMKRDHHPNDEKWYLTNIQNRKDSSM